MLVAGAASCSWPGRGRVRAWPFAALAALAAFSFRRCRKARARRRSRTRVSCERDGASAAAGRRQTVLLLRRRLLLRTDPARTLARGDARDAPRRRQHARPLRPLELARNRRRRVRFRRPHEPAPQPAPGAASGARTRLSPDRAAGTGDPQRVAQRRLPGLAADASRLRYAVARRPRRTLPRDRDAAERAQRRRGRGMDEQRDPPHLRRALAAPRVERVRAVSRTSSSRSRSTTIKAPTSTTKPGPRRTCRPICIGSTRRSERWRDRSCRRSSTPTT